MGFHVMDRNQRLGRLSAQLFGMVQADQQGQRQARSHGDGDSVQIVQADPGPLQGPGDDAVDVLLVQIPGHRRDYATETADATVYMIYIIRSSPGPDRSRG